MMTLSIMTLSIMTLSIKTLSIVTLSIVALSIITFYEESVVDKFKSNLLLMIFWLNIINYNS